ncbi:MAG TPA: PaaI family thioesterase [Candidatus Acidoferrales bacterium]|nr:PaaI family thioesterase [Candidatus Acidoferrales bacterium]
MSATPEKHVNMLAEITRKIASGDAPAPAIARLIGFRPIFAGGGEAVFEMEADERHWNPMGTLHGGVLCDIGDAAMGFAYATSLAEGESFTTIELKINYLRPVWKARLRAAARVVKRGRKIGLVECNITDEKGNLVARASSTCMTLSGEDARGR